MGFRDKLFGRNKSTTTPALKSTEKPVSPGPSTAVPAPKNQQQPIPTPVAPITPAVSNTNTVLQQALEEYAKSLPDAERQLYLDAATSGASINDLFNPAKQQNADNEKTSFLRTHSEGITAFLSTLDRFLDLSATGLSASPQFVGIAVGATQVVIKIFTGFLSYFSRLSGMFGTFASYLGSLNKWAETAAKSENIQEALKTAYIDILTFLRRARLVFVNEKGQDRQFIGWRVFWREFWKPFEDEFGSIEQGFKDHLQVLTTASAAESLGATFELLKAETDRRERERKEEREDFLGWVSTIAVEDVHNNIYRKKYAGTGDWLVRDDRYRDWVGDSKSSLLWCRGKPGSGKSVLASNVIEDLTASKAADDNIGLAFAYFDYRDVNTHDDRKIVTALIKQLCRKKNTVPKAFSDLKADSESPLQLGDFESFRLIADEFKELYLVIDGLDECPKEDAHGDRESRFEMVQFISEVIRNHSLAKVIVTSRQESDIEDGFAELSTVRLAIESGSTQRDIEKFVASRVRELRQSQGAKRLRIQDDALEAEVVQELTSKADGMFLWVELQLKHLCEASRMRKDSEVRKALQSLPKGLDATYSRNVKQINDEYGPMRDLAIVTFHWVLFCERPLTVQEVQHAVAFQALGDDRQTKDFEVDKDEVIIDACANLLEIVKIGSSEPIIQPIHYSVQEYLAKSSPNSNMNGDRDLLGDLDNIHFTLASTCLKYLIMLHEQNLNNPFIGSLRNLDTYPLVRYAADSFDFHSVKAKRAEQEMTTRVERFLEHSDRFRGTVLSLRLGDAFMGFADIKMVLYATRLYNMKQLQEKYRDMKAPPGALVFACSAGLEDAIDELLAIGVDINAKAEELYAKDTPLIAAIRYAQTDVVKKLLTGGADPNMPNDVGPNQIWPLHLAAAQGPLAIMKMLIEHGAHVNIKGRQWKCALEAAGNSEKLKLLLDSGEKIQVHDGVPCLALHSASKAAKRDMMTLLLENGADINLSYRDWGTPLQCLVGSADPAGTRTELVRFMIDAGADANANSGYWGTAMQAAARHGSLDAMRTLLDAGANVDAPGGKYGSPLFAALALKQDLAVKFLLDRGADINASGPRYASALQAACDGDLETVDYLITRGADVNATGGRYGTALQRVAASANIPAVQLLLARGAQVNTDTPGSLHRNALHAALSSTQPVWPETVRLLLTHGADPNATDSQGRPALHLAAQRGDPTVLSLLLSLGADPTSRSPVSDDDAMHLAAHHGHAQIVALLLATPDVDVNAPPGRTGTALQRAASEGHRDVVEMLLDKSADVDAEGPQGRAVELAARYNHPDVVALLVERGARPEEEKEEEEDDDDDESGSEDGGDGDENGEGAAPETEAETEVQKVHGP